LYGLGTINLKYAKVWIIRQFGPGVLSPSLDV
jgi:hypothetical protein